VLEQTVENARKDEILMMNNFAHASITAKTIHLRLFLFTVAFLFIMTIASSGRIGVQSLKAAPANPDENMTGESRYTKLDGARIHYVNYGKGSEALVLIHGWTCNLDNWRDQIPDFAKRTRVIAIDLPGHGQSDKPQITYSMDLFARGVEAVMRDAKVKRAVLVGHSMGTPVARQFYRKYPEKTLGIVTVDGPLRPFVDKATMDGMLAGFRGPNYREAATQLLVGFMGPNLSAEARERIKVSNLNTPQHVLLSAMEGMADSSIWGEDKINVPVLALFAKNLLFPAAIEGPYRELAPKMEVQMWEGLGHFIMMEKPKEFNEAVLAFLVKNKLLQNK
jgi:pimeloyl-ACP methyl ester carboxylesterase